MPELVPGARTTDLSSAPSFATRMVQAARFMITGVFPNTWFGPNQPLQPMAPSDAKGRAWDYPVGWNINYTPRGTENVSFEDMRMLSRACDILRIVIEARKEQLASEDWIIRPKPADAAGQRVTTSRPRAQLSKASASPDQLKRIDAITDFFQYPDKQLSWDQWSRELTEEMLVVDAPAIYRRYTRGGKLYTLDILAGDTIKPLLAYDGRAPEPPNPAYQQIIHGVVAGDFTSEELLYLPRNVTAGSPYGYSPVEQIIITTNTLIRRAISQLRYYTDGTQPDAFVGLPKEWNLDNVKQFQAYFDALMSGNLGQRRKVRFMPGDFKYHETHPIDLKDQYDEWLARIVCFCLSIDPTPFVQHVNRSTAEQSRGRALEEGKAPLQKWLKGVVERIMTNDFASPDLEFLYLDDEEQDVKKQADIDIGYVKAGIFAIDEIRAARGRPIIGGVASQPMLATNVGYIPLGSTTADLGAPGEDGSGAGAPGSSPGRSRGAAENDHNPSGSGGPGEHSEHGNIPRHEVAVD